MADNEELLYPSAVKPLTLPSYFSEQEQAELAQKQNLLAQQQQAAQQYASTWTEKPWYERAARNVVSWLPGTIGHGLTPAETQTLTTRTAKDVDELMRKQRVTIQSQQIINTINMFRAAGISFESEGQLEALFAPISGSDWTQEDRDWILNYARTALAFTEEGAGAGELPAGLSPEDLLTPTKEAQQYLSETEQRMIGSTVAFSKDISEVVSALQEMYTPVTPTKEEAVQQLEDYVRQAYENLGLNYNEDKTPQDNAILYQDYQYQGSSFDRLAWVKENDLAAYEQMVEQYMSTPFPLDEQGRIILTADEQEVVAAQGYIQESGLQDTWDNIVVAQRQGSLAFTRTGTVLSSYLLYPDIPDEAYGKPSTWEKIKAVLSTLFPILPPNPTNNLGFLFASDEQKLVVDKYNAEMRAELAAKNLQYTENYEAWYQSHPEYAPRPEYEGNLKPKLLLSPGYISYLFLRQGLPTITGVALSAGITLATKNPALGGIVASAWFIPMNVDNLHQDLMNSGATWEQATNLAVPIGLAISAVEGLGDIPYLKALSPAAGNIIRNEVTGELVKLTTRQLIKKGIRTAAMIELTETLEEVVQQVMQNAAVRIEDKTRGIFENIPNTILTSLVLIAPFSLFGGSVSVRNVHSNLSFEDQVKVDNKMKELMRADDLSEEQILKHLKEGGTVVEGYYLTAITQLGATEEGVAAVKEAVEKTKIQEADIIAQQEEEKLAKVKNFINTNTYFKDSVKTKPWAIISAKANANELKTLSSAQLKALKAKRSAELNSYMASQTAYNFYPAVWVENGVEGEKSIYVEGIDEAKAREIGTMFKQDTVLTPRGFIYKDGSYNPADLSKVSIDGLETAHTRINVKGEMHTIYVPVDMNTKLNIEVKQSLAEVLEKKYDLDSILIDDGVPVLDSGYHSEGAEDWIEVGTKDIMDYVDSEEDATTLTNMILLHEVGHHLDPLVNAKGGDITTREVNAWKFTMNEAVKYGLKQSDMIRVLRDFAPRTKYEGLLNALIKAGVVPTQATMPSATIVTGDELVPLSGIPASVPNGYSRITGLKEVKVTPVAEVPTTQEGIVMPMEVQQELLTRAESLLEEVPEVKPNTLHTVGIPDGEAFIRTDAQGKVLVTGRFLMRDGKLTLSTIVAVHGKEVAVGRALLGIGDYMMKNDIAFPPRGEMSPDAIRIYDKIVGKVAVAGVGRITVDSVAQKIMRHEDLTLEEEQFRRNNVDAVESYLRAHMNVAPGGVTVDDAGGGQPPLTLEGMTNPPAPQPRGWWSSMKRWLGELIRDIQTLKYTFMSQDKVTGRVGTENTYYRLSYNTELVYSASEAVSRRSLDLILKNPRLAKLITNTDALARIEQELRARNPNIVAETGEGHPALTDAEMEFANTIEKINKGRELGVRYRRFTAAWDRYRGNVDSILEDIPDGNVADFNTAGQFITNEDEEGLLTFLNTCKWGVMQSGFTPTQVYYPEIMRKHKWMETIGYGSLQRRENVELPEMTSNLWQREVKYVTQQDLGFRLTPLMQQANKMLREDNAKGQLTGRQISELTSVVSSYFDTLTQRRASRGAATQFAMNIAGQSYTTIFETYPVLSVRNIIQGLMFYWDRIGLMKSLKTPMVEIENIFFDNKSSEMEGIRRDALLKGETSGLKIFKPLNRLASNLGMFSHSETFSRKATFHAAYVKALKANEVYLKSAKTKADFNTWLKNSDAWVMETPQRVEAIKYLLEDRTSLAVPGLTNVTGAEASALYLADQAVDVVHFRYTRAYRGHYEHSDAGKILFGLSTYPRSYAEMMLKRTAKLMDSSLPWSLRIKGLYEVMAIIIAGSAGAAALSKLTGRKTKSYSPWDMFQWSFGGLTVGVLQDLTGMSYDLLQAVIGDKSQQNAILARLAKDITGVTREFIPWYQAAMYLYETAIDKEYVDTAFIRKFFATINENYTPAEIETLNRSTWEKLQHAIFGGKQTEPDVVDSQAQDLVDSYNLLGKLDDKGELYTLQDFATDVRAAERALPSGVIAEEFGFSDLALFYIDCESYLQQEYYDKYEEYKEKSTLRKTARTQNPNLDAVGYFWGCWDTLQSTKAREIVNMLYGYYVIPSGVRR